MAKLKLDPIAPTDLLEYLESYSDFSFELAILKMLRESGLECEHGGLYEDAVTGKSREFDIRVVKTLEQRRVRLAIECKNIRENFPILISCVPRHSQESFHQVAFLAEPRASIALPTMIQSRATVYSISDGQSIYKADEPVGKSTVQVGRATDNSIAANDSELHEKWGQCLSSAVDLVKRMYDDGKDDASTPYLSSVMPFVVVPDGRLWSVLYDEDGNLISQPQSAERVSCFIAKDYEMGTKFANANFCLSHVEIVTKSGLQNFVERYLVRSEGINEIFPIDAIKSLMTKRR